MDLPVTFAEYDLINDGPCAGLGTQAVHHLTKGFYLDTNHHSEELRFISPAAFSDSNLLLPQHCTSSTFLSSSYPSHESSLHSSLGSTDSYDSHPVPSNHLHMLNATQRLLGPPPTFNAFSFIPIESVITLEPQPSTIHTTDEAVHEGVHADTKTSSMLQHPDVANHLKELSDCFSSGAAQHHMSQLLDWQSQASGSPSQSMNSTSPSCNSTYTRTAHHEAPGGFAPLHDHFLQCSSSFGQSRQPLRLTVPERNFASLQAAKPTLVYSKHKAASSSEVPHLGNSNGCLLENQSTFLSLPKTPVTTVPPQHSLDAIYSSPQTEPVEGSAFAATLGASDAMFGSPTDSPTTKLTESPVFGATPTANTSPSKKPMSATAQPVSYRTVRQSTTARRITYSQDLDMSSDYELPLSKGKARKVQLVQRPRRQNSKPARFCEESQSEEESDESDRPRRKHHNPWSMEETWALIQGVEECGGNKWADIKRRNLRAIEKRTAVDLKDKWRNLLRLVVASSDGRAAKADKRKELPAELVQKVRLLHSLKAEQKAAAKGNRPVVGTLSRVSSCIKQTTAS